MNKYIKYKTKYLESTINNQIGGLKKLKNKLKNNKNNNSKASMSIVATEHLSEPWFSLISLGLKTVEGRKNKSKFKKMKVGDIIKWINSDFKEREILTKIIGKAEYKNFTDYLEKEGLDKCLPGMPSLEHGKSVYYKYFTRKEEAEFGVVAIRLELI